MKCSSVAPQSRCSNDRSLCYHESRTRGYEHVDVPPHGLPAEVLPGILTTIFNSSSLSNVCLAELLTVTAEGEYLLGDHDTKEDGTRLAVESRQAPCVGTGRDLCRKRNDGYSLGPNARPNPGVHCRCRICLSTTCQYSTRQQSNYYACRFDGTDRPGRSYAGSDHPSSE